MYNCVVSDILLKISDTEKGNLLPPFHGLLFLCFFTPSLTFYEYSVVSLNMNLDISVQVRKYIIILAEKHENSI